MTFFRLLSAVLHDPLCVTLYNKVYVFKNKNRIKLFSTVSNFSKTTENMNLFTCLIFVPTIFTTTRPETCIWVPKGYFPSCGYDDHHINQEWELKNYKWAHERRLSTLAVTRLKAYFVILVKKSRALCFGPGPKQGLEKGSYEIQYGCEKRNVESELSIHRELKSVCCSKSDLSKIFEYFRNT